MSKVYSEWKCWGSYYLHVDAIVITKAFDQRGMIFFLSKKLEMAQNTRVSFELTGLSKISQTNYHFVRIFKGKEEREQCIGDYIVAPLTPKISSSRNFSSFTQFSFFPCFSPIGKRRREKDWPWASFLCCRKGKIDFEKNMGGSNKRTLFNWPLDKAFEAFLRNHLFVSLKAEL